MGTESILGVSKKGIATNESSATASFVFLSQLTFARFYLPVLVPSAKKAIYMDDDVIVQGTKDCHHQCCSLSMVWEVVAVLLYPIKHPNWEDWASLRQLKVSILTTKKCKSYTLSISGDILALYNTPLKPGHAAAFSEDCDSASTKVVIRGAGNQVSYLSGILYKHSAHCAAGSGRKAAEPGSSFFFAAFYIPQWVHPRTQGCFPMDWSMTLTT